MSIPPFVPARLRRSVVLFLVVVATGLGLFLIIFPSPDLSQEIELLQKVADLDLRVKHAEGINARRKVELQRLYRQFSAVVAAMGKNCDRSTLEGIGKDPSLGQEALAMLEGAAGGGVVANFTYDLALPGVHDFLPHTVSSPGSLTPAFRMAPAAGSPARRESVSMVLGVPTVKRDHQSYLSVTLKSLLENMDEAEQADTLLVVMVAESDVEYASGVAAEVKSQFPDAVESGLVEVISPPASFYPPWSGLRRTLGDDMGRVQWRSKQNLDYAFLMMYCQPRGTFYVQLEDDILTKPGYVTTMREFALRKEAKSAMVAAADGAQGGGLVPGQPWFVIDYCQLGFIGKLFRSSDLPTLTQFFLMFYNDKPVDWLLENVLQTKICKLDHDDKKCKKEKASLWVHYKPSLFQHIGTHSSLRGKVQKLKDKQFGRVSMFKAHGDNPAARITTQIKHYKAYSLTRAYGGETFYWGLVPQAGDAITIELTPPVVLTAFRFASGNAEHPSDKFSENTSVEVLLEAGTESMEELLPRDSHPRGADGFASVGRFDPNGVAEGRLGGAAWGPVSAVRIAVRDTSQNWVILSEMHLKE